MEGKDQIVDFCVFSPVIGTQQGFNKFMVSCCATHLSLSNNDPIIPVWCSGTLKGFLRDSGLRRSLPQLPNSLPKTLAHSAGFPNYLSVLCNCYSLLSTRCCNSFLFSLTDVPAQA